MIRMLRQEGRLEDEVAAGLLSWRHSGFSVHSAIRIVPWDTEGVERLCRYLVHPPIALGRLQYDGARATYRGRRVPPATGAEWITLDSLEMLARLCQHLHRVDRDAVLTGQRVHPPATVGGLSAPVNRQYADKIHADGYSSDAVGAVELAKSLVAPPG
jgi:hypothetical protein